MPRPDNILKSDFDRWNVLIDNDLNIPKEMKKHALIREVCFAGLYLVEQLRASSCPEDIISRIQYQAGKLSFGRDPWNVHMELLQSYQNKTLILEEDIDAF